MSLPVPGWWGNPNNLSVDPGQGYPPGTKVEGRTYGHVLPNLPPDLHVHPEVQPPTNGGGGGAGTGTGSDPLSTLAAAYMASLGGSGGIGATAPIVIPAAAGGEGAAVNWPMIGALAAVALVLWAVYTWWKKHHGGVA